MKTYPTIPSLGTVLGVWAHPDDEAYLSAALMALVRRHGNRVVVATATAGELGTTDPTWPAEEVARVRRAELAASLSAVGVREHRFLGASDGGLADLPPGRGLAWVRGLIDEVRPDTIVTFGPDGMTGHADHRAVSQWTTAAWEDAGRPSRLWYAATTAEHSARWASVTEELGVWMDGSAPEPPDPSEVVMELLVDGELLDVKERAVLAHASQVAPLVEALGRDRFRAWTANESFVDVVTLRGSESTMGEKTRYLSELGRVSVTPRA